MSLGTHRERMGRRATDSYMKCQTFRNGLVIPIFVSYIRLITANRGRRRTSE